MKSLLPYGWPFLIVATLTFASSQSHVAGPDVDISLDKVAHFAAFGALATSIIRLPVFTSRLSAGFWVAFLISAGFGILDEAHQASTPGRSVEVADGVADALGALTAASLYRFVPLYRRVLEWRPRVRGRSRLRPGEVA